MIDPVPPERLWGIWHSPPGRWLTMDVGVAFASFRLDKAKDIAQKKRARWPDETFTVALIGVRPEAEAEPSPDEGYSS